MTYSPKFPLGLNDEKDPLHLLGESGLSRNSLFENTLMPFSSFNCGFWDKEVQQCGGSMTRILIGISRVK